MQKSSISCMCPYTPRKVYFQYSTHLSSCQWEDGKEQWAGEPHKVAEIGPGSAIASHYSLFLNRNICCYFSVLVLSLADRMRMCAVVGGYMEGKHGEVESEYLSF